MAALTPGEFVVRRSAARRHQALLDLINRLGATLDGPELVDRLDAFVRRADASLAPLPASTPRLTPAFNSGGVGQSLPAAIVANEAAMERLLAGGEAPLVRTLTRLGYRRQGRP